MTKSNTFRITGNVETEDEGSDVRTFQVEATPALFERIKELSEIVKANGLNSVSFFHYGVTWIGSCTEQEFYSDIDSAAVRMEIPELNITEDHFYWTAVPKNGTESNRVSTPQIKITSSFEAAAMGVPTLIVGDLH